ncbi:hypothetical protein Tco_1561768 [Tanacetum coccineum]
MERAYIVPKVDDKPMDSPWTWHGLVEGKQTSSGRIFDNIKYLILFSKMQVSSKKHENWTLNKALEQKDVMIGYFYKRIIYKKLSAYDLELL